MQKIIHYIGLDVHKESIALAIAPDNGSEVRIYRTLGGTPDALDKVIKKIEVLPDGTKAELRFVYEAGPCGYVLCRHLKKGGFYCAVVAPSLIPKKASDRVKTDRRDASQLARLFRAGEFRNLVEPKNCRPQTKKENVSCRGQVSGMRI